MSHDRGTMAGSPLPQTPPPEAGTAVRSRVAFAIEICCSRPTLRRTLRIAVVVGLVLTAINEGDTIVHGALSTATAIKMGFNFIVPFVVSNLGVLAGQRSNGSAAPTEAGGWAHAKRMRMADRASAEGWLLIALGMLLDVLAVGGMAAAIVWTTGPALVAVLVVGNLVLVAGFLVAYRGRLRNER